MEENGFQPNTQALHTWASCIFIFSRPQNAKTHFWLLFQQQWWFRLLFSIDDKWKYGNFLITLHHYTDKLLVSLPWILLSYFDLWVKSRLLEFRRLDSMAIICLKYEKNCWSTVYLNFLSKAAPFWSINYQRYSSLYSIANFHNNRIFLLTLHKKKGSSQSLLVC